MHRLSGVGRSTARSGEAPSRARHGEGGSALMLMPAAVLILVVLASIAVDFTIVRLGVRELTALADAAGNDAATVALTRAGFDAGEVTVDPERARDAVAAAVAATSSPVEDIEVIDVTPAELDGVPGVSVTLAGTVDYVFATALPGAPTSQRIEVTATVRIAQEAP